MEWINTKKELPLDSGSYLISVSEKKENGNEFVFTYVGYFDISSKRWYKYDAFTDTPVKEIIDHKVVGWAKNLTVYLG